MSGRCTSLTALTLLAILAAGCSATGNEDALLAMQSDAAAASSDGGTTSSGDGGTTSGGSGGTTSTDGGAEAQSGASGSGGTGGTGGGSGGSGGEGTGGIGTSGSGGTGGGCKRGVAYGYHSAADLRVYGGNVFWWYNWTHRPDEGVRSGVFDDIGVEYAPMSWGEPGNADDVAGEIPTTSRYLLGFNEPNYYNQADMSASRAAELWPGVEAIASRRGLTVVSPAVNYCGGGCHDTDPFRYLEDFLAACSGCQIDHLAFHIYTGCNPDWLIEHVEEYKRRFTQDLWLTEFACDSAGSDQDQIDFMRGAVEYLENEPRIYRYAWFSGRTDIISHASLLGGDGQLTALGQAYVDMPHNSHCDP